MELHLKQWRDQHESEQQPSAKIPKHFLEPHQPQQHHQHQQQQQQQPSGTGYSSALPLFLPEPTSKVSTLSAFPDSTTRFPKMGSYFSLAQWQELELQALIYRYMLAGAAVPSELLQPIKKSLLHSSPYNFLQHYSHYQPAALMQSAGYWGRAAMDPEPGRCRRTDGKKWRCSRDVVAGNKYCERHMHRGRNRSRKPVEIPTPNPPTTTTTTTGPIIGSGGGAAGCLKSTTTTTIAASPLGVVANGPHFGLSGPSPSIDLLHFNQRTLVGSQDNMSDNMGNSLRFCTNRPQPHLLKDMMLMLYQFTCFLFLASSFFFYFFSLCHVGLSLCSSSVSKTDDKGVFESQNNGVNNRSDGHILRHFFDDWPRSLQEESNNNNNATSNGASTLNSVTSLSISMPGNSSDVSLKLSTGNGEEELGRGQHGRGEEEQQQQQLNWVTGWGSNQAASMGGPLAEALRSSTSNSSPTSVLHHQLPRGSASGTTSYVST
ncbi:hypothetical protein JRO89_XS12G0007800 [Xanthoceras sorbifolium]|uniref:Growth-regulating factor n=1 Tax=Xanthoceras sorbifolium TaxID=99658 RepID=A0ABQ8HA93_9ROSI|nr:hypothetical protein JRO89_XS12G0007800 [Xanthoceras sorbifolium]